MAFLCLVVGDIYFEFIVKDGFINNLKMSVVEVGLCRRTRPL